MKRPLAQNIATARKKKGITQEEAAAGLSELSKGKISRARYAAYEEDRAEPHYDILKTIMEFYNIEDMEPFIYNLDFWKE